MKADEQTIKGVEATISKMTSAYKAHNLQALMECFVADDDALLIGTGPDEQRMGPEQIRLQAERDWAQTDYIEMALAPKSISAAGPVAWAYLDGAFNIQAGGHAMALPSRVSLVLEHRGNQWLIVHSHFSTPAAG